jgi:hypothetical protein
MISTAQSFLKKIDFMRNLAYNISTEKDGVAKTDWLTPPHTNE